MAKRSYQQNCALALALDVIGERWSLLLIRELLTGPKRFNELLSSLQGMGTNLLASRLKELEENGLIRQFEGDTGTSYKSYELSELGRELEGTVLSLVRWGNHFRDRTKEEYVSRPHWLMVAFKAAFQPEQAKDVEETFEVESDGFLFNARIANGRFLSKQGATENPAFRLTATDATLTAIIENELDWDTAFRKNRATLKGSKRAFARVLRCLEIRAIPVV